MGCFIRKQKTLESFDSSVFIFAEIYLIYFLLKISVAISLEKLKNNHVCRKGNLLYQCFLCSFKIRKTKATQGHIDSTQKAVSHEARP